MTITIASNKKKYIVEHNVPVLGIRIILGAAALLLAATLIYHADTGGLFFLLIPIPILAYVFSYSAVDIDFNSNSYHEYLYLLGLKLTDKKGIMIDIQYILVKDTAFVARGRKGQITNSTECYEVSLVGENRFKLVILYGYDKDITINRAIELQEKLGFPMNDMTHEQLIGNNY
jgi:hypothetical protein